MVPTMVSSKSLVRFGLALVIAATLILRFPVATEIAQAGSSEEDAATLARLLEAISADRMLADIRILSAPEFNGRQTGTPDDLASALFVRDRFATIQQSGSRRTIVDGPAESGPPISSLQTRPVSFTTIDERASLRLSLESDERMASIGADYLPVLDSPSAHVSAPVVFVGYGIADPERRRAAPPPTSRRPGHCSRPTKAGAASPDGRARSTVSCRPRRPSPVHGSARRWPRPFLLMVGRMIGCARSSKN